MCGMDPIKGRMGALCSVVGCGNKHRWNGGPMSCKTKSLYVYKKMVEPSTGPFTNKNSAKTRPLKWPTT